MEKKKTGYFPTGTVLNEKWVILQFIGKGAMGEVYRVHQTDLNRDVALKIILPGLLEELDDDEMIEATISRFQREMQTLAQIQHPNVLQMYVCGTRLTDQTGKEFEINYFVMEYIPGATFRHVMSEQGFYPSADGELRAHAWLQGPFLKILDGVQALHEHGITHRDLKPENILMNNDTPKIADLGLARWGSSEPVTDSMEIYGTLSYMSPEQFMDYKYADRRADIYALGKILYEAVRGKFGKETVPFKQAKIENPDTPFFKELDTVIQKATAEDKEDRYDSVMEFRTALENLLKGETRDKDKKAEPGAGVDVRKAYNPRLVLAGVIMAFIALVGMAIWHLAGESGLRKTEKDVMADTAIHTDRKDSGDVKGANLIPYTESLRTKIASPETIRGEDGLTMRLMPGEVYEMQTKLSGERGEKIPIAPFYLDESFVTNYHYADFLNDVRQYLTVEDGAVKKDGEIIIYIGSHPQANEQIIFEHGGFHLRNVNMAAAPVVRVTWYGARAYARHYKKRLPTENEWSYAVRSGYTPICNSNECNTGPTKTELATDTETGNMMHMDINGNADSEVSAAHVLPSGDECTVNRIWITSNNNSNEETTIPGDNSIAARGMMIDINTLGDNIAATQVDASIVYSDVGFMSCSSSFIP